MSLLTRVASLLYPAYCTFRCLHCGRAAATSPAAAHWLRYWLVHALFVQLESTADALGLDSLFGTPRAHARARARTPRAAIFMRQAR